MTEVVRPGAEFELSSQGETHEILETPAQTGDRYRVQSTFAPFAKGPSAHVHPRIEERFQVVSGTLGLRVGRQRRNLAPGAVASVPPRTNHRLWNPADEPAVVTAEIVFTPPGPRPDADLLEMMETRLALEREGQWNPRTEIPTSLLQLAVILDHFREVYALPMPLWLQRTVLRPLAALGRRRGYLPTYE